MLILNLKHVYYRLLISEVRLSHTRSTSIWEEWLSSNMEPNWGMSSGDGTTRSCVTPSMRLFVQIFILTWHNNVCLWFGVKTVPLCPGTGERDGASWPMAMHSFLLTTMTTREATVLVVHPFLPSGTPDSTRWLLPTCWPTPTVWLGWCPASAGTAAAQLERYTVV